MKCTTMTKSFRLIITATSDEEALAFKKLCDQGHKVVVSSTSSDFDKVGVRSITLALETDPELVDIE